MKSEDLRRMGMKMKKKKQIYNFGAIAHEVKIQPLIQKNWKQF